MMVHVAVTWERAETFGWCKCFFFFYAGTEDRAKHPRRDVP